MAANTRLVKPYSVPDETLDTMLEELYAHLSQLDAIGALDAGVLLLEGDQTYAVVTPLSGTKVYYVSDSSGGAVTRKLTFTNGILTAET